MKAEYQLTDRKDYRALARFLSGEGQAPLPMLELIEQAEMAVDELIESPNSGIRRRSGHVTRWKDGSMVLRWVASALVETEKSFRRIMGWEQLWMLKSYLDNPAESREVAQGRKAG